MASNGAAGRLNGFGILFATPLTLEEFEWRLRATPASDYLRNLTNRDGGDAWDAFQETADAGLRLLETGRQYGAQTYSGARLEDLSRATAVCHTVIVLAHWRGASFRSHDLLISPEELVKKIEGSGDPVLREFRGLRADAIAIEAALNDAVSGTRLMKFLPGGGEGFGKMSETLRMAVLRDLLDEVFDGSLSPGNRLEFFDGLHGLDSLDNAVDGGFEGLFDFAMCHSNALAVFLDRRRKGRVRSFHWPVAIAPGPQYVMIRDTLEELAGSGGSYFDLRMKRFEAFAEIGERGDDV